MSLHLWLSFISKVKSGELSPSDIRHRVEVNLDATMPWDEFLTLCREHCGGRIIRVLLNRQASIEVTSTDTFENNDVVVVEIEPETEQSKNIRRSRSPRSSYHQPMRLQSTGASPNTTTNVSPQPSPMSSPREHSSQISSDTPGINRTKQTDTEEDTENLSTIPSDGEDYEEDESQGSLSRSMRLPASKVRSFMRYLSRPVSMKTPRNSSERDIFNFGNPPANPQLRQTLSGATASRQSVHSPPGSYIANSRYLKLLRDARVRRREKVKLKICVMGIFSEDHQNATSHYLSTYEKRREKGKAISKTASSLFIHDLTNSSDPSALEEPTFPFLSFDTATLSQVDCAYNSVAAVYEQGFTAIYGAKELCKTIYCGNSEMPVDFHSACKIQSLKDVKKISCGNANFAALTKQWEVYAWGKPHTRDGDPWQSISIDQTMTRATPPARVEGLATSTRSFPIDVVCGDGFTVVLVADFSACKDSNIGPEHIATTPSLKKTDQTIRIPANEEIAIEEDRWKTSIFAWGVNHKSQCAVKASPWVEHPTNVQGLDMAHITSIACGSSHMIVLSDRGYLYAWGCNEYGQCCGNLSEKIIKKPQLVEIPDPNPIKVVACGCSHSAALNIKGELYTWGDNKYGELGRKVTKTGLPSLVRKLVGQFITHISCGPYRTAACTDTGDAYVWGRLAGNNFVQHSDEPCLLRLLHARHFYVTKIFCGVTHFTAVQDLILSDVLKQLVHELSTTSLPTTGSASPLVIAENMVTARRKLQEILLEESIGAKASNVNSHPEKLHHIELENHHLIDIPEAITSLAEMISSLNLSRNTMRQLTNIDRFIVLTALLLHDNRLAQLPPEIGKLQLLRKLDVSSNQLTELAFEIGALKRLTHLLVADNKLNSLVESIGQIASLTVLDVSNNNLNSLPKQLGSLPLKLFKVSGNPLKNAPQELLIARNPSAAILSWFQALSQGTKPCYRARLMVVGEEGVGKTTLLHSLRNDKKVSQATKDPSSNAIDIEVWKIECITGSNRVELVFNTWDFAGQELFFITQPFLSVRAIYVVVFNATDPNPSKLALWLKSMDSKANLPILLVGTHSEHRMCTSMYLEGLKQQLMQQFGSNYSSIVGVSFVSSKSERSIEELKQKLVEIAFAQSYMGQEFPKSYLLLEEQVMVARKISMPPTITWEEWEKMSEQSGIAGADLIQATAFLHELGVLVHINERGRRLNEIIILDPFWVAQAIAGVIAAKNTRVRNGLLLSKDWPAIWKPPQFPPHMYELLVSIMAAFEILYPLNLSQPTYDAGGEYTYCLIPGLLSEDTPKNLLDVWPKFENKPKLARVLQFGYCPYGFFSRLLTRVLHLGKALTHWQNGMVMSLEHEALMAKAFIEFVPFGEKPKLKLEVRGAALGRWMRVLMQIINSLIEGFGKKMTVERYVVCSHCLSIKSFNPYMIPLDECVMAVSDRKAFIYCNGFMPVLLHELVPEFAMADIPRIEFNTVHIEKQIAKGGFGLIFKGTWHSEQVAVKQLIPNQEELEDPIQKITDLCSEAWFLSCLNHPNIVKLKGVCIDPFAIVTEFVPYGDLYHYLQDEAGPLERPLALRFAIDIANGMRFLHGLFPPFIHRDLKSPNVLLASLDASHPVCAKVSDLGIASIAASSMKGGGDIYSDWQSPEVQNLQEYTEKADVYSFAMILWELFTRKKPFDEFDFKSIFMKRDAIYNGLRPTIPDDAPLLYTNLIEDCWDHEPTHRPSFEVILDRLVLMEEQFVSNEETDRELDSLQVVEDTNEINSDGKSSSTLGIARRGNETAQRKITKGHENSSTTSDDLRMKALYVARYYKRLTPLLSHSGSEAIVQLLVTEEHVWSACEDGSIAIWNSLWKDHKCVMEVRKHKASITSMTQAGDTVWAASKDGTISIWDKSSFKYKRTIEIPGKDTVNCMITANDQIWAGCRKLIFVWNPENCKVSKEIFLGAAALSMLRYGSTIWVATDISLLERWSIDSHKKLDSVQVEAAISSMVVVDNFIWAGTVTGKILVYDAETVECLNKIDNLYGKRMNIVLQLVSMGPYVISAHKSGSVVIWNKYQHEPVQECIDEEHVTETISTISIIPTYGSNRLQLWCGRISRSISVWIVVIVSSSVVSSLKNANQIPAFIIENLWGESLAAHTGPDQGINASAFLNNSSSALLDIGNNNSGSFGKQSNSISLRSLARSNTSRVRDDSSNGDGAREVSVCRHAFGTSISNLDMNLSTRERQGDPNADCFFVEVSAAQAIIGIADGMNWGVKARQAAVTALACARKSIHKSINDLKSLQPTIQDFGNIIVKAFNNAQEVVLSNESCGSTDMCIGIVCHIKAINDIEPSWGFICGSIGMNAVYCWASRTAKVIEITKSKNNEYLGKDGDSSVKTLNPLLYFYPCHEGDIIFLTTDGVYLNLDPEILKSSPYWLGLPFSEWTHGNTFSAELIELKKKQFTQDVFNYLIGQQTTAQQLSERIIEFTHNVTQEKRAMLEKQSMISTQSKLSRKDATLLRNSIKALRGKLDHATCVSVRVGRFVRSLENSQTQVLERPHSSTVSFHGQAIGSLRGFLPDHYLAKEGHLSHGVSISNWKPRWCILNENHINILKKPKDKKPVAVVLLNAGCQVITCAAEFDFVDKSGKRKKHLRQNVFGIIEMDNRITYLQAVSTAERQEWTNAILNNINLSVKNTLNKKS